MVGSSVRRCPSSVTPVEHAYSHWFEGGSQCGERKIPRHLSLKVSRRSGRDVPQSVYGRARRSKEMSTRRKERDRDYGYWRPWVGSPLPRALTHTNSTHSPSLTRIHTRVYPYTPVHTHTYSHSYTPIHSHTHTHPHSHVLTRPHSHSHTHLHVHTHSHTYTQLR